jgi:poly-gamma-glutamate synthesis protein (capsule biosynthesis protein)
VVIVSIHWGTELLDWPSAEQRRQAEWLVQHGADVIFGHHPHVVQAPECILGKPVFFSLGNHVFDQKYPETKQGLIAECRISGAHLKCGGWDTHTPASSFFPELVGRDKNADATLASCSPALSPDLSVAGFSLRPQPESVSTPAHGIILTGWKRDRMEWLTRRQDVVSLETGQLAGPESPPLLFSLEHHYSPIDNEVGLRPYVYAVAPHGLVARWRGSALAWPLLDARIMAKNGLLCALHRGDSFIAPQPSTKQTRVAVYQWNGFGFRGIDDPKITRACAALFADER